MQRKNVYGYHFVVLIYLYKVIYPIPPIITYNQQLGHHLGGWGAIAPLKVWLAPRKGHTPPIFLPKLHLDNSGYSLKKLVYLIFQKNSRRGLTVPQKTIALISLGNCPHAPPPKKKAEMTPLIPISWLWTWWKNILPKADLFTKKKKKNWY